MNRLHGPCLVCSIVFFLHEFRGYTALILLLFGTLVYVIRGSLGFEWVVGATGDPWSVWFFCRQEIDLPMGQRRTFLKNHRFFGGSSLFSVLTKQSSILFLKNFWDPTSPLGVFPSTASGAGLVGRCCVRASLWSWRKPRMEGQQMGLNQVLPCFYHGRWNRLKWSFFNTVTVAFRT